MCDRFRLPTDQKCSFTQAPCCVQTTTTSYTGNPRDYVQAPNPVLESKNRFVRGKGMDSFSIVTGGVEHSADGPPVEMPGFHEKGRFTKKHHLVTMSYAGGAMDYKQGAGRERGYDLYWRPTQNHRRTPIVVNELDPSIWEVLRHNPLAGPLPYIPADAKEEKDFMGGCEIIEAFEDHMQRFVQKCGNEYGDMPNLPGLPEINL